MKELSIEEKARAYDEALEKAKEILEMTSDKSAIYTIFPELKESEDERIRKNIIKTVELYGPKTGDPKAYHDMISWLEKKGEPIDKIVKRAMNEKQKVLLTETNGDANIDWDTRSLQDVKLLLEYGLDYIKKLEKQGEQKASYTTIVETGDGGINAPVTKELPTDSEQKPADKVESHFHVEKGKWYMCIKNNVGITKGNAYYGISDGYIIDDNGRKYNCKNRAVFQGYLRLWDITIDARAGDVLACPNDAGDRDVVFIFKSINSDEGWVFCFCASDANGCFCTNNDYVGNSNSTNISPATKEQRDLLFQKMKEDGYTFEFEHKKLKKIEPKLAWSEEDEEEFQIAIDTLVEAGQHDSANWLKSLKGRVGCEANCTTTKEWSEDDKRKIDRIYSILRQAADTHAFSTTCRLIGDKECIELQDWLKSLRPQNRRKPRNS